MVRGVKRWAGIRRNSLDRVNECMNGSGREFLVHGAPCPARTSRQLQRLQLQRCCQRVIFCFANGKQGVEEYPLRAFATIRSAKLRLSPANRRSRNRVGWTSANIEVEDLKEWSTMWQATLVRDGGGISPRSHLIADVQSLLIRTRPRRFSMAGLIAVSSGNASPASLPTDR